jgi:hypothetical protein
MDHFEFLVEAALKSQKNIFVGNKKDPDDLVDFVQTRAAGAKKIQVSAEAKGGLSLLTAAHFRAKQVPYKVCAKHANDSDSTFIKQKADECFDKLKSWDKMTQKEFQFVMGQLEAYGECFIRSLQDKGA